MNTIDFVQKITRKYSTIDLINNTKNLFMPCESMAHSHQVNEKSDCIRKSCFNSVSKGKIPLFALANGNWLGDVPAILSDLKVAEQFVVARVRHNRCLV